MTYIERCHYQRSCSEAKHAGVSPGSTPYFRARAQNEASVVQCSHLTVHLSSCCSFVGWGKEGGVTGSVQGFAFLCESGTLPEVNKGSENNLSSDSFVKR